MNKKVMIIILVLVLAAAGVLYFTVFKGEDEEPVRPEDNYYSYVPGDYFITNVKDSSRLLKVTIVLQLDSNKLEEKLKKEQYIIRDNILFYLRSLREEDILSEDIEDNLRANLKPILNEALGFESIVNIYFNDFVMS